MWATASCVCISAMMPLSALAAQGRETTIRPMLVILQ